MPLSVNAKASLTARMTVRAETKVGVSDPAVCEWKCRRLTDKSYPGDNRLISPKSSHRRGGFGTSMSAHRILGLNSVQGFGCSPIKAVRELVQNVVRQSVPICRGRRILRGAVPSTRGPGWTHLWCTSCHASGTAGQLCGERINAESI